MNSTQIIRVINSNCHLEILVSKRFEQHSANQNVVQKNVAISSP